MPYLAAAEDLQYTNNKVVNLSTGIADIHCEECTASRYRFTLLELIYMSCDLQASNR